MDPPTERKKISFEHVVDDARIQPKLLRKNGTSKALDSMHNIKANLTLKAQEAKSKMQTKRIHRFIIGMLVLLLIICIAWFYVDKEQHHFKVGDVAGGPFTNGLYYFTTTVSTVGYGDILPVSTRAKLFTSFMQMFVFILSLGLFWKITDGRLSEVYKRALSQWQQQNKSKSRDSNEGESSESHDGHSHHRPSNRVLPS